MKIISAFRVVHDFGPLRAGEVFKFNNTGCCITSLDTRNNSAVLRELYNAAIGEPSAFELNYDEECNATPYTSRTSKGVISGIMYTDLTDFNEPHVEIKGAIARSCPKWCQKVLDAAKNNDRYAISRLLWDDSIVDERATLVHFVNEPRVGCLYSIPFWTGIQTIVASTNIDRDGYATPVLSLDTHSIVDRGYMLRRCHKQVCKPVSGRLDGFVLKVIASGQNPYIYERYLSPGIFTFYSGGNGELVRHPGSAYIYKTEVAAEGGVARDLKWVKCRDRAGGPLTALDLTTVKVERQVMSTDEWREEMFGQAPVCNLYAEAVK